MNNKKYSALMLALSMIYGAIVAVLAVTGSSALEIVAIIGGAIIGIGWVSASVLAPQKRD